MKKIKKIVIALLFIFLESIGMNIAFASTSFTVTSINTSGALSTSNGVYIDILGTNLPPLYNQVSSADTSGSWYDYSNIEVWQSPSTSFGLNNSYKDAGIKVIVSNSSEIKFELSTNYSASGSFNVSLVSTSGVNDLAHFSTTNKIGSINTSPNPTPSSPTLTATAGDQQVSLTWNSVANANTYDVYQNDVKVATGITSTSYAATGLTDGTSYNFYVKAIGSTGSTSASNTVSATPNAIVPASPTLTATAGDQQVTLNWTSSANSSYFNVFQNSNKIASNVTATTYTITGLTDGTSYSFYVQAVGSTGGTSTSNILNATPTSTVVNPPTNVTTTGTSGSSGTISWTQDPNAPTGTTYTIYKNGQPIGTTSGNSYTDTNYSSTAVYTVTSSYNGKTSQPSGGSSLSSPNWGFTASDLFSNTSLIVASVAGFLLLGVAIFYARRLITFIRWTVLEKYKDHRYYQSMGYTYKDGDYWKDGRGIKQTYYNNMKDTYGDSWERSKRKWWQRGWLS